VSGATDAPWRRLSPRMLLVHPVIEVGRALPAIAAAFLAGHSGGGNGSRWGLAIAAAVAALALLRWFSTSYRITAEQIQLRYGLVRRRSSAAPIDRVRTVDVTSHLLHRLLRLSRVTVGTGTSDRKGRNALVLDGLDAAEAAGLRAELLHRHPAAIGRSGPARLSPPLASVPARPTVETELARLDPAWLRFAPFTPTGAVTALAVLGVGWRVITEGRVNLRHLEPYRRAADQLARWPIGLDIAVVAVSTVAFVALASTVGYLLAFWRFRLTRHSGGTLHVTRGLLTTRATSIERRRLRGVELSEPLLLRAAGGARCLAIATGLRVGRGAERGGEVLLPAAPTTVAVSLAATVIDSSAPFTVVLARHPAAALRRRIARAVGGASAIVAGLSLVSWAVHWSSWLAAGSGVLVLMAVPLGIDRYRSLGHAEVGGFVVTRAGCLIRRRCAVHVDGVIGWNLRSTFFQRRLGLSTLTATTAAGRQGYRIDDLAGPDAVRFADHALPGLLTEFLG
jgi:putative membrane protein